MGWTVITRLRTSINHCRSSTTSWSSSGGVLKCSKACRSCRKLITVLKSFSSSAPQIFRAFCLSTSRVVYFTPRAFSFSKSSSSCSHLSWRQNKIFWMSLSDGNSSSRTPLCINPTSGLSSMQQSDICDILRIAESAGFEYKNVHWWLNFADLTNLLHRTPTRQTCKTV